MLSLQRAAGNQAVARILSGPARSAPIRGVRPGSARGLLQRVLERFQGPEPGGKAMVTGFGLKDLYKETDDGTLYFVSTAKSTKTEWHLFEVKLGEDGRKYVKTGEERKVKAPPPRTLKDWLEVAYVSRDGDTMLYPAQKYPHVTINLTRTVREPTDVIEFTTMHYSRSDDDPYRSGYKLTAKGWQPVLPNDRKDKQKECDDAVDRFLEAVRLPTRVIRD